MSSSFFASSFNFAEREEAPYCEPRQWDVDELQQLREQLRIGKESGGNFFLSVNAFVSIDILTIHCRRQSCASSDIPEETWEEVKKICGNVPAFIVLFYQRYRLKHSLTDALKILQESIAWHYEHRISRLVTRNVRTEPEKLQDSVLVYNLVNQKAIVSVSWQAT